MLHRQVELTVAVGGVQRAAMTTTATAAAATMMTVVQVLKRMLLQLLRASRPRSLERHHHRRLPQLGLHPQEQAQAQPRVFGLLARLQLTALLRAAPAAGFGAGYGLLEARVAAAAAVGQEEVQPALRSFQLRLLLALWLAAALQLTFMVQVQVQTAASHPQLQAVVGQPQAMATAIAPGVAARAASAPLMQQHPKQLLAWQTLLPVAALTCLHEKMTQLQAWELALEVGLRRQQVSSSVMQQVAL